MRHSCDEILNLLQREMLSDSESELLVDHIESCENCRKPSELSAAIKDDLSQTLGYSAPPKFEKGVMSRIRRDEVTKRKLSIVSVSKTAAIAISSISVALAVVLKLTELAGKISFDGLYGAAARAFNFISSISLPEMPNILKMVSDEYILGAISSPLLLMIMITASSAIWIFSILKFREFVIDQKK